MSSNHPDDWGTDSKWITEADLPALQDRLDDLTSSIANNGALLVLCLQNMGVTEEQAVQVLDFVQRMLHASAEHGATMTVIANMVMAKPSEGAFN